MEIVEDTEMARSAKRLGMRTLTASGRGAVSGRMYTGWKGVWNGFTKNSYGLTGYRPGVFVWLFFSMGAGYILPYVLVFFPGFFCAALAGIGMNVLIRSILALKYREPWAAVLLHPAAAAVTMAVGVHSVICYRRGYVLWKGRRVYYPGRRASGGTAALTEKA